MSTSAIPTFKAALKSRLSADANLTGVDITYGIPYSPTPPREWIMLGNARPEDGTNLGFGGQVTAAMGQRRREERFILDVFVSCIAPVRESQQTLTERAFTLAGYVETSLRNWSAPPNAFSGAGVRWALVTAAELSERLSSTDREALVTLSIACAERI